MAVDVHPHYFYDEQGQPKLVLLSYEEYLALIEEIEDRIDSAILEQRVRNAGRARPLREVMQELDGIPQ